MLNFIKTRDIINMSWHLIWCKDILASDYIEHYIPKKVKEDESRFTENKITFVQKSLGFS